MRPRLRKYTLSIAVFGLLLLALVSVDERVRTRFDELLSVRALSSWDDRVVRLGDAVTAAVHQQSVENGPLVLFATVGAALFVFMFRT